MLSLIVFAVAAMASGAGINIAGLAVVTALLYLVLIIIISSVVEGRRKGVDRLVTGVVASAFLIAMVPLVSVAWTVVVNGVAGLSAEFFTSSMRNVVGEGGGVLHAIVGTLLITLAAAIISIPIGLFTAIYLVEYGSGPQARARHHVPRRRHDRHPVDRRRACSRTRSSRSSSAPASTWASWARSPCPC